MQRAGGQQVAVPEIRVVDAQGILDDYQALNTAIGMFDDHPRGGQHLVVELLSEGKLAALWLLERLLDAHALGLIAQEAQVLAQYRSVGQFDGIQVCNGLAESRPVVGAARLGRRQVEHQPHVVAQQIVLEAVTLFLAAVLLLLGRDVAVALNGPLGTIVGEDLLGMARQLRSQHAAAAHQTHPQAFECLVEDL